MVIAWGFNVAVSALHLWRRVLRVKECGGIIHTVDARFTEAAKLSNKFIKVRPGSEGYLALGIAKYLVDHDLVDRSFVERYTYGFNELVKHLENYNLDVVERVTGVPKSVVAEFAEDLANHKPFAILIGYGLQRRRGGGEFVVVHETHWSDTARVADLVLPAPMYFEKLDAVFSYSHNVVYLTQLEPGGVSISPVSSIIATFHPRGTKL
jgi:anaerobic selenocysteine-containing dehydrogenase